MARMNSAVPARETDVEPSTSSTRFTTSPTPITLTPAVTSDFEVDTAGS